MKLTNLLKLFVFLFSTIFSIENKTILVTGGAGFIGSNFVQYMFDKYPSCNITVLDSFTYSANIENIPEYIRNSSRFVLARGDICDPEIVDSLMSRADFVVHLAAESDVTRSICDDRSFFISNVMGTRNLLHYLVKYMDRIERFVHISSSEVYGTCSNDVIDEGHPLDARSPYAASKVGADRTVYSYGCTYNAPVVTLRFFNNYGPRQHYEKATARFIISSLNHQPLTIHGSGEQMRDWIYVFDTARAIDAALHVKNFDTIRNEVINCGTGIATSIIKIAESVLRHIDTEGVFLEFTADRPGQVFKHLSSTNKAKELLGWEAMIDLEEGMSQTVNWYQTHPAYWQNMVKNMGDFVENSDLIDEKIKS